MTVKDKRTETWVHKNLQKMALMQTSNESKYLQTEPLYALNWNWKTVSIRKSTIIIFPHTRNMQNVNAMNGLKQLTTKQRSSQ